MPDSQTDELRQRLLRLQTGNPRSEAVVDGLNELGFAYYRSDPERGIECAEEARELAEALGYGSGLARSYKIRGVSEMTRGKYAEAKESFDKCLEIARETDSRHELATGYTNLGILYRNLGVLDAALTCSLESVSLHMEAGSAKGQAASFINIGNIYSNNGEYEKALEYHTQALAIFEESGDLHRVAIALSGMSNAYSNLGKMGKAVESCERALSMRIELGEPLGIASSHQQLGSLHEAAGEFDLALAWYRASLPLCEKIGQRKLLTVLTLAIGRCEGKLGQRVSAIQNLQRGIDLADELEQQPLMAAGYRDLSELFEQQGDFEQAYRCQRLRHDLEREVAREEVAREIARIEMAHEIKTKEQEAELHRLRTAELEKEIDERRQVEAALRDSEDRFRRLSREDSLTGVSNRRHFLDVGCRVASRAHAGDIGICIGMLDLDNFKRINDQFGHQAGDRVLKEFARIASSCIRPDDFLARYGGEEFVILFRDCGLEDGIEIMSRINRELGRGGLTWHDTVIPVTVSGGIVHSSETGSGESLLSELIRLADSRLYAAKESGRNRIVAA